jgi:hypothetical protein
MRSTSPFNCGCSTLVVECLIWRILVRAFNTSDVRFEPLVVINRLGVPNLNTASNSIAEASVSLSFMLQPKTLDQNYSSISVPE